MFVFSSVFLRLSLLTRQGRDDVTCKRRGRRFLFFLSFLFTRKKTEIVVSFPSELGRSASPVREINRDRSPFHYSFYCLMRGKLTVGDVQRRRYVAAIAGADDVELLVVDVVDAVLT